MKLYVRNRFLQWVGLAFAPLFFFSVTLASQERGMIVAASEKYISTLVPSILILREVHGCFLPIEVWHAGDELNRETIRNLQSIPNVKCRDICQVRGGDAEDYRGYQIKGYMIDATDFDEVVLFDADAFFFRNPENLFAHPAYLETGAFLFRDAEWQMFGDLTPSYPWYHEGKAEFYHKRRNYILRHVQQPSQYVPEDWRHYWDPDFTPTPQRKVTSEHVETGCVIFDRVRHKKAIEFIVSFNDDRKEFFHFFWGEKETFWLGLEKAKEPYYINPTVCYSYYPEVNDIRKRHDLVHFVDGSLFFIQKAPKHFPKNPILIYNRIDCHPNTLPDLRSHGRSPTDEEKRQLWGLAFWYQLFSLGARHVQ